MPVLNGLRQNTNDQAMYQIRAFGGLSRWPDRAREAQLEVILSPVDSAPNPRGGNSVRRSISGTVGVGSLAFLAPGQIVQNGRPRRRRRRTRTSVLHATVTGRGSELVSYSALWDPTTHKRLYSDPAIKALSAKRLCLVEDQSTGMPIAIPGEVILAAHTFGDAELIHAALDDRVYEPGRGLVRRDLSRRLSRSTCKICLTKLARNRQAPFLARYLFDSSFRSTLTLARHRVVAAASRGDRPAIELTLPFDGTSNMKLEGRVVAADLTGRDGSRLFLVDRIHSCDAAFGFTDLLVDRDQSIPIGGQPKVVRIPTPCDELPGAGESPDGPGGIDYVPPQTDPDSRMRERELSSEVTELGGLDELRVEYVYRRAQRKYRNVCIPDFYPTGSHQDISSGPTADPGEPGTRMIVVRTSAHEDETAAAESEGFEWVTGLLEELRAQDGVTAEVIAASNHTVGAAPNLMSRVPPIPSGAGVTWSRSPYNIAKGRRAICVRVRGQGRDIYLIDFERGESEQSHAIWCLTSERPATIPSLVDLSGVLVYAARRRGAVPRESLDGTGCRRVIGGFSWRLLGLRHGNQLTKKVLEWLRD